MRFIPRTVALSVAAITLTSIAITAVPAAAEAAVIRIPRLTNPEIRVIVPAVTPRRLPSLRAPTFELAPEDVYGSGRPQVETELTQLTRRGVDDVDQTLTRTDADATLRRAVRSCASSALRDARVRYEKALRTAAYAGQFVEPSLSSTVDGSLAACLEAALSPQTPPAAIEQFSAYVTAQLTDVAVNARLVDPRAGVFTQWLAKTGDALAVDEETTEPVSSQASIATDAGTVDPGSTFPWLPVGAVVAVLVLGGIAGFSSRPKS